MAKQTKKKQKTAAQVTEELYGAVADMVELDNHGEFVDPSSVMKSVDNAASFKKQPVKQIENGIRFLISYTDTPELDDASYGDRLFKEAARKLVWKRPGPSKRRKRMMLWKMRPKQLKGLYMDWVKAVLNGCFYW